MRLASTVFALLLTSASLAAQTSAGNSPAILVGPAAANACPVQIHVDRKLDGAIIETGSEFQWLRNHSNLPLPDLLNALKSEPGFRNLTAESQREKLDRVTQLYNQQHGAGLDIIFNHGAAIVSADVAIHGYPPAAHIIPADPLRPREVTETFHLTSVDGKPLVQSSIWTKQMIMVNWVELTRVEYADGTSWQSSSPRECGAAPSLFVLVDSAR